MWKRVLFKYVPPIRWRYRAEMMDFRESFYDAVIDKNTPFADLLVNMSKDMMKAQLPDRSDLYEFPSPVLTVIPKTDIRTLDGRN
jgi:hypothetical protein